MGLLQATLPLNSASSASNEQILALYAKGMAMRDIEAFLNAKAAKQIIGTGRNNLTKHITHLDYFKIKLNQW